MAEDNLQRMKTLDDSWHSQDWEVFRKRHSADTQVFWPGQPEPTRGREAHEEESKAFFASIENQLENDPYKVMFASGEGRVPAADRSYVAVARGGHAAVPRGARQAGMPAVARTAP